jgi:hypothetical protein
VPPRSIIAAARKLQTMCFKFLDAKDGLDEAYDKHFEDQDRPLESEAHIEIFETLVGQLEDAGLMIRDFSARTAHALAQMQAELELEQAADRTLDVPAKTQKAKLQKLEVSDKRREAISRAKAQAEEGAAPF